MVNTEAKVIRLSPEIETVVIVGHNGMMAADLALFEVATRLLLQQIVLPRLVEHLAIGNLRAKDAPSIQIMHHRLFIQHLGIQSMQ